MTSRRLLAPVDWPCLDGRRYVVTGATRGLGFFAARRLAELGAVVVLAGRDAARLERASAAIRVASPSARPETCLLDTAEVSSARAAGKLVAGLPPIDGLLLNAGLVVPARARELTGDGIERTLATNAIGHFAFAALALPNLADEARLVWLGSLATMLSRTRLVDPQLQRGYRPSRAYAQSKLAVHVLATEWERRRRAAGHPIASVIAHPGYGMDGVTSRVPGVNEPGPLVRAMDLAQVPFTGGTSKERASESLVAALVDPAVEGGDMIGPRFRTRGRPVVTVPHDVSAHPDLGRAMWARAAAWTGVEPAFTGGGSQAQLD